MAKELLISFIYDSQLCQKEEDDPQAAVVYFHPSWTSDDQKLALCGQLMGVTQFMALNFQKPTIVSFASGKFAVRYFKRYILFVGSDQNLSDTILQTRAETLYQLIRFYHRDICTVNDVVSKQPGDSLSEKLAHMFQIYLPVLQYATNVFGNIPTFKLPKSANSIFLEAMQILRNFQENSGVIGGLILYQNRVICSQLSPNLTKLLVLTDPYRIKLPAENVAIKFNLPVGMQLLTVYANKNELSELTNETQSLLKTINELESQREEMKSQISNGKPTLTKESTIGLKRDISRNFTLLEEDEEETVHPGLSINTSIPDLVKDVRHHSLTQSSVFNNTAAANTVAEFSDSKLRSLSAESIPASLSIPVRYYSLGFPPLDFNSKEKSKSKKTQNLLYNSICDPVFPYFKSNGLPASSSIHDDRLTQHYSTLFQKSTLDSKVSRFTKKDSIKGKAIAKSEEPKRDKPKRPMNLNLHSLADTSDAKFDNENKMGNRISAMPIPLTPLMAKLNALKQTQVTEKSDLNDLSAGDSPVVNSQLSIEEMLKQLSQRDKFKKGKKEPQKQSERTHHVNSTTAVDSKSCRTEDENLEELGLFVYGFQNTTLLLLLKSETSCDSVQVNSLFDRSVDSLHKLESHLVHSLSTISQGDSVSNSYSFMALDPDWGTFYRGGTWVGESFELLSSIYNDLREHPDFSEIVLRSNDSTVYGSQLGHNQIFYQQRSQAQIGGLPAPSDLMGTIHLKAKRRLERDHGFVLF
ncbi:unnamed protein product [Bemisia tabaci]|uniref:CCZ1/INTU/HSP4 first Longin domain-containing protein n=1 Tax=Bemisia tabaci TaxID=7038 RepID=A0A9P0FZG3_BEMTA|nr:unnamed protein product [Bemisia tabaci]